MVSRLIVEVNEECGLTDTASSSEDDDSSFTVSLRFQHKQLVVKLPDTFDCSIGQVLDTFAPRSVCQSFASAVTRDVGFPTGLKLCAL
jgi:hypothetical protein